ncbi:MAG TPA: hypothetical protein V6C65_04020 [Allocoleopsis sp.]
MTKQLLQPLYEQQRWKLRRERLGIDENNLGFQLHDSEEGETLKYICREVGTNYGFLIWDLKNRTWRAYCYGGKKPICDNNDPIVAAWMFVKIRGILERTGH